MLVFERFLRQRYLKFRLNNVCHRIIYRMHTYTTKNEILRKWEKIRKSIKYIFCTWKSYAISPIYWLFWTGSCNSLNVSAFSNWSNASKRFSCTLLSLYANYYYMPWTKFEIFCCKNAPIRSFFSPSTLYHIGLKPN